MKGPSVALAFPPENFTRAPLAGGVSPSSPRSTPALVRDSLYLVILATRSAGGTKSAFAFSYALGITSIMKRIVVTLDWSSEPAFPVSTNTSNQGRRNRLALGGLLPELVAPYLVAGGLVGREGLRGVLRGLVDLTDDALAATRDGQEPLCQPHRGFLGRHLHDGE